MLLLQRSNMNIFAANHTSADCFNLDPAVRDRHRAIIARAVAEYSWQLASIDAIREERDWYCLQWTVLWNCHNAAPRLVE